MDAEGRLLFEVLRKELLDAEGQPIEGKKTFIQRRPDGKGGWIWDLKGVRRELYRLPAVLKAETVWVVEGEKDVHTLEALGVTATTSSGGAGARWESQFTEALRGRHVIIVPDTDKPGEEHGAKVAAALHGAAASVKIVPLPYADMGVKDVTDYMAGGSSIGDLRALAEDYVPPAPVSAAAAGPAEDLEEECDEDDFPAEAEADERAKSAPAINKDIPSRHSDEEPESDEADPHWQQHLQVNRDHNPRAILRNAIIAFRRAPEWHGKLRYNEFSMEIIVSAGTILPWANSPLKHDLRWSDQEDRMATDWLQARGIYVQTSIAGQAVETVALHRPFHPVRDYLKTLQWDGIRRIHSWLTTYLGVLYSLYVAAVGECWLISAVARVRWPGCQADHTLILEGRQGSQKSTALRSLTRPWFTDDMPELGTKDAALQCAGAWLIELAELEAMGKAETPKVKAFISRRCDRFRPPYGRRPIEVPRQCIFAATVNPNASGTYRAFQDETGGRRFWPVRCTKIDIDGLVRDRDQLWAEAVERYEAGAPHWLTDSEVIRLAESEQADRYEGDAWAGPIEQWLKNPTPKAFYHREGQTKIEVDTGLFESDSDSTTTSNILTHCLGKMPKDWNPGEAARINKILTHMKWEKHRPDMPDGTRHPTGKFYRPGTWVPKRKKS
ncbi:MAG TPA: VapE domain-containing protein [Bryobacteraceae bacterium]|nr:VapE domain-containing protein [Bryobacteraceae bacterium]